MWILIINIHWEIRKTTSVYSYCTCLKNPMDRGAWQAVVHRVAKNQTWLKQLSMHAFLSQTKSLQSCPILCDPIDGSPPSSPVPGILQAKTLEWVIISIYNAWKWKVKVKSLSRVQLLATLWTAAYQAPPSMGFARQEYWSGVPLPSLAHIPTACQNVEADFTLSVELWLLYMADIFWLLTAWRSSFLSSNNSNLFCFSWSGEVVVFLHWVQSWWYWVQESPPCLSLGCIISGHYWYSVGLVKGCFLLNFYNEQFSN